MGEISQTLVQKKWQKTSKGVACKGSRTRQRYTGRKDQVSFEDGNPGRADVVALTVPGSAERVQGSRDLRVCVSLSQACRGREPC